MSMVMSTGVSSITMTTTAPSDLLMRHRLAKLPCTPKGAGFTETHSLTGTSL
jgi:hypothetical protein